MMSVGIHVSMRNYIVASIDNWEVVWSGELARLGLGLDLVGDRATKPNDDWTAPSRLYNKTGKHSKKVVDNLDEQVETKIINPIEEN